MRIGEKPREKLGQSQFILMFFAFSLGMVLSNLLAQNSAQQEEADSPPLFIYKGKDKYLSDISPDIRERLEKLDRQENHLLELAAIELHTHQTAHDKQLSLEEAGLTLFPNTKVLEQEVADYYQENEAIIAKPFYLVRNNIERQIRSRKLAQAKEHLLSALKKTGDLHIIPVR